MLIFMGNEFKISEALLFIDLRVLEAKSRVRSCRSVLLKYLVLWYFDRQKNQPQECCLP